MSQLPNYIRPDRKRLALSQSEMAFLMGMYRGASVSRYEQYYREPNLEKALALEVIFGKPVKELFPGLYQKVEREVRTRAKTLIYKTDQGRSVRRAARKRQRLASIINRESNTNEYK
jgi:transcriptional regulator with XRE-family HTH domain